MRLISWNVRRARDQQAVIGALASHAPDVVVLVDPPQGRAWHRFVDALHAAGFHSLHASDEEKPRVAITARCAIEPAAPSALDLELRDRWVEVLLPEHDVRIAGVYVPVTGRQFERKQRMWNDVRVAAAARANEPMVITGDWNSGDHPMDKTHPGRPFRFIDEYRRMAEVGWTEAWRCMNADAAEFSWYRHDQRGFRIDHAFVSPALRPRLQACRYSHAERVAGVSDHSMLMVELE